MRRKNNTVPRFQSNQCFENNRRRRIRRRNNAGNHAQRLRHFGQTVCRIVFNHATGLGMTIFVVNFFRRKVVFDYLVFHNAHSGFGHGHFGQRNTILVGRNRHRFKNPVNLFLIISCQNFLSAFNPVNNHIQIIYTFGAVIFQLRRFFRATFSLHVA